MKNDSPFHRQPQSRCRSPAAISSGTPAAASAASRSPRCSDANARWRRMACSAASCTIPPKAKRVVQLFMAGAASHIDLFDYKPELVKRARPADRLRRARRGVPERARARGSSRSGISSRTASAARCSARSSRRSAPCVDDIAFVHNMVGKIRRAQPGDAAAGDRVSTARLSRRGLLGELRPGLLNDNLPTFVVLPDHRGFASNGTKNWDSRLPARRSTRARSSIPAPRRRSPICSRHKPASYITPRRRRGRRIDCSADSNREHAAARAGDERLEARIRSYELAAKMQLAAPEALDLSKRAGAHPRSSTASTTARRRSAEGNQRRRGDRLLRPQVPGRPAAAGARRAVRADLERATTTASRAATGTRTKTSERDHGPLALGHGPRLRGASSRI